MDTINKMKLGKEYTDVINQEWKGKRDNFKIKLKVKKNGEEKR